MQVPKLDAGSTHTGMPIQLVPPNPQRVELPFALVSDPLLMRDFMLGRKPYRAREKENYRALMGNIIQHPLRWVWWITSGGVFEGIVGTLPAEQNEYVGCLCAPIYCVIKALDQHQGIATVAVECAVRYLFQATPLEAVEARILTRNTASLGLAAKLGFRHDRTVTEFMPEEDCDQEVWYGYRLK